MIMIPIWLSIATTKPECRPVVQSKKNQGTTRAKTSVASHGHCRRRRPPLRPAARGEAVVPTTPSLTCRGCP